MGIVTTVGVGGGSGLAGTEMGEGVARVSASRIAKAGETCMDKNL
jgi:hypothetical protein